MVFARAWRPRAAARFSRRGARTGASGSVRDRARSVVVERLRRRSDFRAAARGERASGRAFVLQARSRGDEGAVRVGFTVSRQVGNSVERNRVRRRLREVVRVSAAAAAGQLCPGHDYVLIGRRAALAAPFGEMMRGLLGFTPSSRSSPGELVVPAPTPYMKRVRHPCRKSSARAAGSRYSRPSSRPGTSRKSAE